MDIKLLDASNAESYWALRLEALKQNPEAFLTSYDDAIKMQNPFDQVARNFSAEGNYTFGAFDQTELIGVVTFLHESAEKIQHRANIFAMYVKPEKQGLGVGKALMTEAINKAKSIKAIEKINLSVMASNEKAKRLYGKLGFQVYGCEENAFKVNGVSYNDEHMVLHLNPRKEKSILKIEIIEQALQVASLSHRTQCRKNTDIPYITHPVAVGMLLMKAGYSEEIIAAGILHDTVEDTDLTLEEIEQKFGLRIARIVEGCSEPNKSLPWIERKEHTIEFLKTAPEEIRVVACADKLHNIRSIINDSEQLGESVWDRFNAGKEKQKWYYTHIVQSLGQMSSFPLLKDLQTEVQRLFR